MSGFNFAQIGNVMSEFFDSDFIDIKRDVGGNLQELYSNIPCHIAFNSTDNPDPTSVDTKPIIQSINVHMPLWVDIKNNDFIVAKRMDNAGNLLMTYSGRCGNPIVSQGRQKVLMTMSATEPEEPTPVPPQNPAIIKINYLSNGIPIQDSIEKSIEVGSSFTMNAPIIEGYSAQYCVIDGITQESAVAYIADVTDVEHTINFVYTVSEMPNMMRFLVNGIYTKDDGSLANGWHQYKKIDIDSISESEETFTIICDDVKWIHEDNGKSLSIKAGAKLVLIPRNIFVKVDNIVGVSNNKVTFTATEFTPTEAEENSYVTGWYD
jgi:hypothetical protein